MEIILPLIVFLFPLAFSPGPGNIFFAANGARYGVRATLAAIAGYHVATFGVTLLCGFGFAGVVLQSPNLLWAIRWIGSGYVLFLAFRFLSSASNAGHQSARPAGFVDGFVLLVFNPKAYVIIALMFSQFLQARDGLAAVVLIAVVFTLNNLVAFLLWTVLGERLGRLFRKAATGRALNIGFGVMLAGVAVWMAFR